MHFLSFRQKSIYYYTVGRLKSLFIYQTLNYFQTHCRSHTVTIMAADDHATDAHANTMLISFRLDRLFTITEPLVQWFRYSVRFLN